MAKVRLDTLLAQRGLFESRARAAASVMAGEVRVGGRGERAAKPGQLVADDVAVRGRRAPALRLARRDQARQRARRHRHRSRRAARCLDVGASTGGFTDCLLQARRGARRRPRRRLRRAALVAAHRRARDRARAPQRPRADARAAALRARPRRRDVSFISLAKVLPAVLACRAERFDALAMVKPQFEVGRDQGRARAAWCAAPATAARALVAVARARATLGAAVLGFASSGLPGPKGNRETFVWLAEAGRARARSPTRGGRARRSSRDDAHAAATVLTHAPAGADRRALEALVAGRASAEGVVLRFDADETRKHGLPPRDGLRARRAAERRRRALRRRSAATARSCARCAATRARACRSSRSTSARSGSWRRSIPRRRRPRGGLRAALAGDFEVLTLPALALETPGAPQAAINDLSSTAASGERVAQLAYAIDGEEVGRVRCDGLVVATPAGSTGYNLANGGPVMAWGVEGFVVSFIAPHSLTARALVVAPERRARGPQPLAGARSTSCSTGGPAGAARTGRGDHGVASCARPPTSRRCRARRSTGACARSSGGWPHEHDRHRRGSRADRPACSRGCSAARGDASAR